MWWASFVFTLAEGRIDRETEEFLLWELPLSRALAYQHCALRKAAQWTVPVGKPVEEQHQETSEAIREYIAQEEDAYIEEDFE